MNKPVSFQFLSLWAMVLIFVPLLVAGYELTYQSDWHGAATVVDTIAHGLTASIFLMIPPTLLLLLNRYQFIGFTGAFTAMSVMLAVFGVVVRYSGITGFGIGQLAPLFFGSVFTAIFAAHVARTAMKLAHQETTVTRAGLIMFFLIVPFVSLLSLSALAVVGKVDALSALPAIFGSFLIMWLGRRFDRSTTMRVVETPVTA